MATYTLISATTLANSTTGTVTFSAIPNTFTDLELLYETRDTTDTPLTELVVTFNGESASGTLLSSTIIRAQGSGGSTSQRYSSNGYPRFVISQPSTYTANSFASGSLYIPNYLSTTAKPMSIFGTPETNATSMDATVVAASYYRNTAAITSIAVKSANNFLTGSSLYLYGIKNS